MARKPKPKKLPLPPDWTVSDVAAIQALERGEATAEQQKCALKFLIVKLAGTYEDTFTEDARESDMLQGKRRVGLMLVMAYQLNLMEFTDKESENA